MAVNSPTDKQAKDKDIARKLKLYGAVKAFQAGSLPDNAQLDSYLVYLEKNSLVDPKDLSQDGQTLVHDLRDIVETTRMILQTRNSDELLQRFITGTNETSVTPLSKDAVAVSTGEVKEDFKTAAPHLAPFSPSSSPTLRLASFSTSESSLHLGVVGRDIFAQVAVKGAENIRPDKKQLKDVDRQRDAGKWIGAGGQAHGYNSTPNLELNVGGHKVVHDPKAPSGTGTVYTNPEAGEQATSEEAYSTARDAHRQYVEGKENLQGQALDTAKQTARVHDERGTDGIKDLAREKANQGREVVDEAAEDEETKRTVKQRFSDFRTRLTPEDETQNRARAHVDSAKDFLDDQFPQERRDQFIWRLKKVVVEVQKHSDYDGAMTYFLDLLSNYKGHAATLNSTASDHTATQSSDPAFQRSFEQLKTLLQRTADGHSIDGITQAVDNIFAAAREDDQLRVWFADVDTYVRKSLLEPGYILDDDCSREGQAVVDRGREFFDEKYRSQKDALFDEITAWGQAVANDPLNETLSNDFQRFTKDLLFNDKGTLEFKPHLWKDIRTHFLPSLIEHISYIPIPRIEASDKTMDLVMENLVLEGSNLFPNIVDMNAKNHFKFSPYSAIKDGFSHEIYLEFKQCQADLRDVGFFLRKKTGFPKITDSGLADVLMAGEGLSISVTLLATSGRTDSVFEVKKVLAHVGTLKIAIHGTNKDWLYKLFSGTASGLIKKAIAKSVEQAVKTSRGYIDQQLVGVRNRMDEAKNSDGLSRNQILKELFQKKKDNAEANKRKVEAKVQNREAKFAIVTDREKSILPQDNPPQSTASDMFQREDLALTKRDGGAGWQSPAFDL